MTTRPTIRVDFQNADPSGDVRLNTRASLEDLERIDVAERDGLQVRLESDEFATDGVVRYSEQEQIWVAELDWTSVEDL